MGRLSLVILLWSGCQDYLFNQVCPEAIRESSIVVPALAPTPTDILFVVDNSGSMADEQENLADNFDRFIQQIAGNGDYHIAVVSTDQQSPVEWQGLRTYAYAPQYPNKLYADQIGGDCVATSPPISKGCFRGPDPTTRIVDSNTMDPQAQINVFGQNVRLGSCGDGEETGLLAMMAALDQRSGCNTGFLRDSANLLVVIVSDEQDADNTPVQQYVESLKQVKGGAAQIRVAVIAGVWEGRADNCSIPSGNTCGGFCQNMPARGSQQSCTNDNQCPGSEICVLGRCDNPDLEWWDAGYCFWCSYYNTPDCCSAAAGGRYVEFALAMEQEIVRADSTVDMTSCRAAAGTRPACRIDTICQADFGETLAAIARDLVPRGSYNLSPPAKYPPGINVTVKGGRFPEGKKLVYNEDFQVTEDGSVLTIVGENSPNDDEEVEIHFVVDSVNRSDMQRGACNVSGSP